jgi:hypothetical protein
VSCVVSPLLARSSVVSVERVPATTRTGPQGEPPGRRTRLSPSAATVKPVCFAVLSLWNLSFADLDSICLSQSNFATVVLRLLELR